jgi:hypothetical protein
MSIAFGYVALAIAACLVTLWLVDGIRAEQRDRRQWHALARRRS